jgi:outer membrane protein assembly factor BamB
MLNYGTTYYYTVFINNGSGVYSDGKNVKARPFATTGWVKWAYSTGAANLAPPGVRPGVLGTGAIYDASNDRNLHATNTSTAGGDWPRTTPYAWTPLAMNGPAQGRPAVIPLPLVVGANRVVFLGSQDGYAYAANAETGAQLWQSAKLGDVIQAPVSGMFTAYGGAYNLVFVPTRNATTANRVCALDPADKTLKWSFDNGGGSNAIGIISSGAVVDYANRRLYFTSRARGGGSSHTLWCISFTDTTASWVWSRALGDIDSAPVLYEGRVYVGNNQGVVYAVNATTGVDIWSYDTGDASAVKSYIICDITSLPRRLYFSTADKVWSLTDNGTTGGVTPGGWPITSISSPSHPLLVYGTNFLVVGSSNGSVYQINVSNLAISSAQLGDGLSAAGSPSFDVTNNMVLIGTAAGVLYGVVPPLN